MDASTEKLTQDTADIRPDEDFDHDKLAAYLKDKLPAAEGEVAVEQFPGGHSNLTYLVRFGDAEYVVRRRPLGPVAPKAHDMGREYKVLSRLHEVFPQAPRAYHFCEDESIMGAPFLVMERRKGIVLRHEWPEEFGEDVDLRRRISTALIDTLAELHTIDYASVGLGDFGKPEGFVNRQVEGWAGRWERAKTRELDTVGRIVDWLREKMPESEHASLIHNDFKLDNVMLDPADPGRITSIFDWEMSTLGDPLLDLGTSLAYYAYIHLPGAKGRRLIPTQLEGFLSREELIDRYAEKTGFNVDKIRYFEAFALFKNAVVLEQIYVRFVKGQTRDKRFAALGVAVPALIDLGLKVADESDL